jgi:hypothetical protein
LDSYSWRREQNSADLNQTSTVPDKLLSHESAYAGDSFAPAGRRDADANHQPTGRNFHMELADEVVAVLSPLEMKTLRKRHAGWTLKMLSEQAKVSIAQLSQFENGRNGLRLDQVRVCEKLLLRAAAEHEQMISMLFNKRNGSTTVAS